MSELIWRVRGAVACFALATGAVACAGVDTVSSATDGGGNDVGTGNDSASEASGSSSGTSGSSHEAGTSGTSDGGASGSSSDGGASGFASDGQAAEASLDSGSAQDVSTVDSTISDGATLDGDGASSPPAPVQLCAKWDSLFGLDETDASVSAAAYDRTQWWVYSININFGVVASQDCRVSNIFGPALTSDQMNSYGNDLNSFTQQFMGCPLPTDGGALTYGILPAALSSQVFSSSDLTAITQLYIDGITSTLQCGGPCPPNDGSLPSGPNFPQMPSLTADQLTAIRAQLDHLASMVPNTVTSTSYEFNSCPNDAGTDASDGSASPPSDAAANGG